MNHIQMRKEIEFLELKEIIKNSIEFKETAMSTEEFL